MPADDLIQVTIRGRAEEWSTGKPIREPFTFTPQYDGALIEATADAGRGVQIAAKPRKVYPDSTGYVELDVPSVGDTRGNPTAYNIKVDDPTRRLPYFITPDHTLITPDPVTGKYYYNLKDVIPAGTPIAGDSVLVQDGITQGYADAHYLTTAAISGKADTSALTAETSARTSADSTLASSLAAKADASALTSGLAAKADAAALTTETSNRAAADTAKIDKTHMPAIAADAASVDNTGATDTGTALQAFLDSLAGTEQVARLYGTFKHSATIVLKGHVDASGATFNYTGSGLAVQVGAGGSAVRLDRVDIHLPKIINTTKPGTGWTAGTVGCKVINLNSSFVWVPDIVGFETGLLLYGQDQGTVYSHFFLGQLDNNKRNLMLDANTGGWVNQNNYYGGRFSHNSGEGSLVAGTRHILMTDTPTTTFNNNNFYGPSLESPGVVETVIDVLGGVANLWDKPRFEWSGSGGPTIHWGADAVNNKVRLAHHGDSVTETFTTGASRNDISADTWERKSVSGTKGVVFENVFSSNSPQVMGLRAGGTAILGDDPSTAYAWRGAATSWGFKRATDAFDRLLIDATNGQILTGNGAVAPANVLGAAAGSTVNAYTSAGTSTWTKPAGCNAVIALVVNAGAGGASGRRGAAGSVRCGGGGGAGGGYSYRIYPASVLSATETVTVGAGGAGGAAVTTDNTDGNPGTAGGLSFFKSQAVTQMGVPGGGGGGTASTGTAGTAGMVSPSAGGVGGAASTTGGAGVAPSATAVGGATGGGSGGGVTSADAVSAGGAGASLSGLAGGTAGTSSGGAGGAGNGSSTDQPGAGGGGGGSSITGAGGTGGAGALRGGGGGGGGASLNGNNSGAGGAGADGCVVLVAI